MAPETFDRPSAQSVREGVDRFIRRVTIEPTPTLQMLGRALDEFALTYHWAPRGEPSRKDFEPVSDDYNVLRGLLSSRFPDLGFYWCPSFLGPPSEKPNEVTLGDAIDDLADIIGDAQKTIWRFKNAGMADACWHHRWSYEIHWGRHLRALNFHLWELQSTGENWS